MVVLYKDQKHPLAEGHVDSLNVVLAPVQESY
jgi:hypothetical protein